MLRRAVTISRDRDPQTREPTGWRFTARNGDDWPCASLAEALAHVRTHKAERLDYQPGDGTRYEVTLSASAFTFWSWSNRWMGYTIDFGPLGVHDDNIEWAMSTLVDQVCGEMTRKHTTRILVTLLGEWRSAEQEKLGNALCFLPDDCDCTTCSKPQRSGSRVQWTERELREWSAVNGACFRRVGSAASCDDTATAYCYQDCIDGTTSNATAYFDWLKVQEAIDRCDEPECDCVTPCE